MSIRDGSCGENSARSTGEAVALHETTAIADAAVCVYIYVGTRHKKKSLVRRVPNFFSFLFSVHIDNIGATQLSSRPSPRGTEPIRLARASRWPIKSTCGSGRLGGKVYTRQHGWGKKQKQKQKTKNKKKAGHAVPLIPTSQPPRAGPDAAGACA
jgi:hypothetical protein